MISIRTVTVIAGMPRISYANPLYHKAERIPNTTSPKSIFHRNEKSCSTILPIA